MAEHIGKSHLAVHAVQIEEIIDHNKSCGSLDPVTGLAEEEMGNSNY
jgi:hypothetical protein